MIVKVFDLDGCIIDSSHRYRTIMDNGIERIDLDFWRENEKFACRDGFLPAFYTEYLPAIDDDNTIVIVATARVLNEPDKLFLTHFMPRANFIISRPSGCTISGGKLKVNGLKRFFNLKQFSNISEMVVYEDNINYLKYICDEFKCKGIYIPSIQGH